MAPFIDPGPSRRDLLRKRLAKWIAGEGNGRPRAMTPEDVLSFVESELDDPDHVASIKREGHIEGFKDGFSSAVTKIDVLTDGPAPDEIRSDELTMLSITERYQALARLRWRPVSEVPDDGVYLGWADGVTMFYVGYHKGERRFYDIDALINGGNYIRLHPTHFMVLPSRPGDEQAAIPDFSGCKWLLDAIEPFARIADMLRRFADATKFEEVQINPMLNLEVHHFEAAGIALERLRAVLQKP